MGERTARASRLWRVLIVVVSALIGWIIALPSEGGLGAERVPRGYLVPVVPGGTALRLAMVHDVLTERYPRHSQAWHEARVAKRRAELERLREVGALASPAALSAGADLAVSLDLLQRGVEAEPVLREQLAVLPPPIEPDPAIIARLFDDSLGAELLARPLAQADRPRYAAYANLATVLAHTHAKAALGGDAQALPALREARDWVQRALTINPGAHFGRELWQVCALDWLISVAEDPQRLTSHDLLGRAWEHATDRLPVLGPPGSWRAIPRAASGDIDRLREAALTPEQRSRARAGIPQVAISALGLAEHTWCAFDRPVLGMLGMWMHGGGPSPHLALALAHLLEGVEQRWLAWEAYARALTMAERFPERGRAAFVLHCRARQMALAGSLAPADPASLQQRLEGGFAADLAEGLAWQQRWQEDERQRLAAGGDVDDPALSAAVHVAQPVPSTAPGEEDYRRIGRAGWTGMGLTGLAVGLWIGLGIVGALALVARMRRRRG